MATKKAAKKSAKKASAKYSPAVGKQIKTELDEMKAGTLKSGRNGKKVTNPKQAIAIAISEARKKGAKVPPNPNH
jgi:23S rRNA maturation mini-RNase III